MSGASSPYHGILECLLERPVNLIADFLDRRFVSNDQGLAEVWLFPFPVKSLAERIPGELNAPHRFV